MDLVSVIVPIYKVEAYLDRCRQHGLAEQASDGRWHLTPEGFLVSNRIIGELQEIQDECVPLTKRR